jgi:hypothetical protein
MFKIIVGAITNNEMPSYFGWSMAAACDFNTWKTGLSLSVCSALPMITNPFSDTRGTPPEHQVKINGDSSCMRSSTRQSD